MEIKNTVTKKGAFSVSEKDISSAVINRLPRYYRYLGDLLDKEVVRISSKELSERMHVTASQIRQDLNNFGGFGQQGYGYNVEYLYNEIAKILGLDREYEMVIVGAGNLGQAIAGYTDFEKRGFKVKRIFDINPNVIGTTIRGIIVDDVANLEKYVKENNITIAALTIPKSQAVQMANNLANWGIKGIWNFAPVDLRLPSSVKVETVHLSDTLMRLSYSIREMEENEND